MKLRELDVLCRQEKNCSLVYTEFPSDIDSIEGPAYIS